MHHATRAVGARVTTRPLCEDRVAGYTHILSTPRRTAAGG